MRALEVMVRDAGDCRLDQGTGKGTTAFGADYGVSGDAGEFGEFGLGDPEN